MVLFCFLFSCTFGCLGSGFRYRDGLLKREYQRAAKARRFKILPVRFQIYVGRNGIHALCFRSSAASENELRPFFQGVVEGEGLFRTSRDAANGTYDEVIVQIMNGARIHVLVTFGEANRCESIHRLFVAQRRPAILRVFQDNVRIAVQQARRQIRTSFIAAKMDSGCVWTRVLVNGSVAGASYCDQVNEAFVFGRVRVYQLLRIRATVIYFHCNFSIGARCQGTVQVRSFRQGEGRATRQVAFANGPGTKSRIRCAQA